MSSATSVSLDAQTPDAGQTVYYKDTATGTFTLTFAATGYTSGTWSFTVTPCHSRYKRCIEGAVSGETAPRGERT